MFNFLRNLQTFSQSLKKYHFFTVPFYMPINCVWRLRVLHTLTNICFPCCCSRCHHCRCCRYRRPSACEAILHCGFHFLNDWQHWTSLHELLAICIDSLMFIQALCLSFLIWMYSFFKIKKKAFYFVLGYSQLTILQWYHVNTSLTF